MGWEVDIDTCIDEKSIVFRGDGEPRPAGNEECCQKNLPEEFRLKALVEAGTGFAKRDRELIETLQRRTLAAYLQLENKKSAIQARGC